MFKVNVFSFLFHLSSPQFSPGSWPHLCILVPTQQGFTLRGPMGTLCSQLELNPEAGWQVKAKLGTPGGGHDPGRGGGKS